MKRFIELISNVNPASILSSVPFLSHGTLEGKKENPYDDWVEVSHRAGV